MAWQSIPYVTTGLGLVAFALAGIFYFFRYRLKQRAEIIRSASAKDRLDAIALTAEQFRVDVSGLPVGKQAEIVLRQISLRRRRELMATTVILVVAVLLTIVALVAMLVPGVRVTLPSLPEKALQQNEATVYGPTVRITTALGGNPGCQRRVVQSCARPERDGGIMVPGSGRADFTATIPALADWRIVEDSRDRICIEFSVNTRACENENALVGRAVATERFGSR